MDIFRSNKITSIRGGRKSTENEIIDLDWNGEKAIHNMLVMA